MRNQNGVQTHFATLKSISQAHTKSKSLCEFKQSLKTSFKGLQALNPFRTPHLLIVKPSITLRRPSFHRLSLHWMPRGQPFEEATYISHPISDMARIRGAHTDPSLSREPRPRASSPRDSTSQAPEAPTVPSSEGEVPCNPSQRRYKTRRPPTSLPLEPSIHCTLAKRIRTSGPRESSRHSQPDPGALADS